MKQKISKPLAIVLIIIAIGLLVLLTIGVLRNVWQTATASLIGLGILYWYTKHKTK